jgi:exosortase/archaeosortase family protein
VKQKDFNILLFLALFLVMQRGFYVYVGLTTPGGRLFFPFLAHYVNIPWWLTLLASKSSKLLLELCHYYVNQANPANISIAGSRGVTIAWGCLGIGAMSLWIAFIAAHFYPAKQKLKWMFAGVLFIYILNILRIMMIALSNHYNWQYLQSFNAHTTFNILTYGIIVIMMLVFAVRYNKENKQRREKAGIAAAIPGKRDL